jgi:hypothetical protein
MVIAGALASLPVHLRASDGPETSQLAPNAASEDSKSASQAKTESKTKSESAPATAGGSALEQRKSINLLGQTDAESGESRRNENVQFNLIDNNVLKELNIRLGPTATVVEEFRPDRSYFGSELGGAPSATIHAQKNSASKIHGNVFEAHQNNVFSARSFFQVGAVQPAHENNYGGEIGLPVWRGAYLMIQGSQSKMRGSVNGNVLVPLPSERTPLATDPELRSIVQNLLDAYPKEFPNRTDIADRALNTNSPQQIDTDTAGGQFDQSLGSADRLMLRWNTTIQHVHSFQFVTGQNPNTDTRSHTGRLTWNHVWSPATVANFSAGFDRLGSLLVPAEGAVGFVSVGFALTDLGPSPIIPIDRTLNWFRYGAALTRIQGNHSLTAGATLTRLQYSGEESDAHRRILMFRDDFGRDAITNLRMGTPGSFIQSLGSTYRAFRNWEMEYYLGDHWQLSPNWTVNWGVRYQPFTQPWDAAGHTHLSFGSDLNNIAPSVGLAYRLPGRWGVIRSAYGLQYGEIFPVTFGQDRYNPPYNLRVFIDAPDLTDPALQVRFEDLDPHSRSAMFEISPDLTTPYSHQYNFSWELEPAPKWRLQFGYVGSRSIKLLQTWFLNRAVPVPGIPFESETINDRRPDQTMFDHLYISNASRGYYDAARVTFVIPGWHGLTLNASYWFSKALDLGTDYTNTASPVDARDAVNQAEFEVQKDLKGRSSFDQPHAFILQGSYETPRLRGGRNWTHHLFGSWNLSGVWLLKQGTPFTVEAGSDAPGFGNVDGGLGDRPNLLDPSILDRTIGDPDTSAKLLPRSAFSYMNAPAEMAGTLGRNTFRKGRIANVNAALSRSWTLSGEARIAFRAESINFLNTPQFDMPTRQLTSPSFGQINNTLNDGRAFRFTLRIEF